MLTRLAAALALTGLAALPAAAQGSADCVANGMIQVIGFSSAFSPPQGEGRIPAATVYSVSLLGSRPFRTVTVGLLLRGRPTAGAQEVELPPGQVTIARLARLQGPVLSDAELRAGLRVRCTPQ